MTLITLYCISSFCKASLTFRPVQSVMIGETAVLTCDVKNENFFLLAWFRVYTSTWTQSIWFLNRFINQTYLGKYSVTTDNLNNPTVFQLTIKNVQLDEFGDYLCTRNGGGASSQATLLQKTITTISTTINISMTTSNTNSNYSANTSTLNTSFSMNVSTNNSTKSTESTTPAGETFNDSFHSTTVPISSTETQSTKSKHEIY